MNAAVKIRKRFLFGPNEAVEWAEKMVLNPAMVRDPEDSQTIHMLFRATGPGRAAQVPGKPLPYPIYIGYAVSHDGGESWEVDWSRPALQPSLKTDFGELFVKDAFGRRMFNYANGCMEDPRLQVFDDELYLILACRPFPPGPYWDHDDPVQCMPDEVRAKGAELGRAVAENCTVSLLYKVDLEALKAHRYEAAFSLVTPLHQPDASDDRDVLLFPRRLTMGGKKKIVCLHRPKTPWNYPEGKDEKAPAIFMAVADELSDFYDGKAEEHLFARAEFPWEANRVGTSWAPLEIGPGRWLLPYHGKQDDVVGYTQSFMILEEDGQHLPKIAVRPSERLLYASEPWELEGDFTIPCLFTCSGVVMDDARLLMGYGAADAKVGLVEVDIEELVNYLKTLES